MALALMRQGHVVPMTLADQCQSSRSLTNSRFFWYSIPPKRLIGSTSMTIVKQAARQTLGQLIGANNPPVLVPDDSQRQYAWTKKEVDTFWQDIIKFKANRKTGRESSSEYFIGPIVTITEEKVRSRGLLDGQQRLTTSTILISVLRDHLWTIGNDESKAMANSLQRDYISRTQGRRKPQEYFLTLSLFDRDYFRDAIQAWSETDGPLGHASPTDRPSHRLIREARVNLDGKVSTELAQCASDDDRLDWIDALRECLVEGLVFVEIQTPTSSDANEVFETINSRGRDLSTVDLVRNFLMERSRDEADKSRVNSAWQSMLDGFERRENIERFLRHFWVARHGDVKAHGLYTTIKEILGGTFERGESNVAIFSQQLHEDSQRYSDLTAANTGSKVLNDLLEGIKALGADSLLPLLLAASARNAYGDLEVLASAGLSYYVRWTVVGRRESTILEEKIYAVAKELSGGISIDSCVEKIANLIPEDEAFKADFKNASIAKSSQIRYLLQEIEKRMRASAELDDVVVGGSNKVHVEHIYPQNPAQKFRLKEHEKWVNRIGNQTLLHGVANRRISNKPYPEKKSAYDQSSLLVTTATPIAGIWDFVSGKWTSKGIIARQNFLAEKATLVWPGRETFVP